VIAEIALALVLVIGAGLLVRSFRRVLDVEVGFDPRNVLTAQVDVPFGRWTTGKPYGDFFLELADRLSRLPGVESAAATTMVPNDASGNFQNGIHVEGHPPEGPGEFLGAQLTWVTPQYFRTLGVPLLRGRLFDDRDRWRTAPVIVVNEAFVRKYLPGEEPVGARARIFNARWNDRAWDWNWTVIGVVRDAREWGADRDPRPAIFIDVAQQPSSHMTLVVRTSAPPLAVVPAVRATLGAMDATLALAEVRTLEDLLSASLAARRFQMQLVALFGVVALALAALGLSGVIAQSVAQRTREFGIRMALGAQPRRVLAMVVRQGLRLGAFGVGAGLLFSLAATRALQGALFGVSAVDPLTYAGVAALLVLVAAIASWLPARRATRVDPAIALRAE
jgi:putative ABC transport system permease protein